jgi:hypothetical protein
MGSLSGLGTACGGSWRIVQRMDLSTTWVSASSRSVCKPRRARGVGMQVMGSELM